MIAANADYIQVSAEVFENPYSAMWRAFPASGRGRRTVGQVLEAAKAARMAVQVLAGGLAIRQPVRHDAGNALRARE